jgi:hypothetical protein
MRGFADEYPIRTENAVNILVVDKIESVGEVAVRIVVIAIVDSTIGRVRPDKRSVVRKLVIDGDIIGSN